MHCRLASRVALVLAVSMGRSKNEWTKWTEHEVGEWLKNNGLKECAPAFVENRIKGEDLPEVISDEDTLAGM